MVKLAKTFHHWNWSQVFPAFVASQERSLDGIPGLLADCSLLNGFNPLSPFESACWMRPAN